MINGTSNRYTHKIKEAFESGYSNAAAAFGRMANDKVYFNNFHHEVHTLDIQTLFKKSIGRHGRNIILTTEIFGDLSGKSYLLLSDAEFDTLTIGIPQSKDPKINFKEEFAKELDNILSASVITRLSNELSQKMYGDIPILLGIVDDPVEDLILNDFKEQMQEVYVNAVFFSFEKRPEIKPIFIWVVDGKVVNILKETEVLK